MEREIKLVEPPKEKFSWTKVILSLNVGEKFKAKEKYAKTIAPRISREIKLADPERVYETDNKTEPKYLIVERIS
jgi:hypothetical protein